MPKTRAVATLTTTTPSPDRSPAAASSMRAARLALLLTTAIAWGMTAQSVGTLRSQGGGAQRGDPVPELVRR